MDNFDYSPPHRFLFPTPLIFTQTHTHARLYKVKIIVQIVRVWRFHVCYPFFKWEIVTQKKKSYNKNNDHTLPSYIVHTACTRVYLWASPVYGVYERMVLRSLSDPLKCWTDWRQGKQVTMSYCAPLAMSTATTQGGWPTMSRAPNDLSGAATAEGLFAAPAVQ